MTTAELTHDSESAPREVQAMPTLIHGDCIDELRRLDPDSIDAIITDPPYGLGFMGKAWDELPPGEEWARECLRVLKPGGHLLAFGGTRTWHRLAAAVEDAGFEIRDSIAWMYGSGFPKSMDVSKAIDKAGVESPEIQAQILRDARTRANLTREQVAAEVGCTPSSVRDWEEGRSREVGRAVEYITPSPKYRNKIADLLGYTSDERRAVGAPTTDRRGDGTVIGLGHSGVTYGDATTPAAKLWQGWGTALKPAFEPIVVARKPLKGTVAANVLEHGTGALNIDACRIGTSEKLQGSTVRNDIRGGNFASGHRANPGDIPDYQQSPGGRWPANVVLDEHAAEELDAQSGVSVSRVGKPRRSAQPGEGYGMTHTGSEYNDTGGASRFFYCAKAPKSERPVVDGIAHPTVKPIALMRWLVRLVTPIGGVVLDPFAGSGTTVEAALLEGFDVVGIEREADYLPLIHARISRV